MAAGARRGWRTGAVQVGAQSGIWAVALVALIVIPALRRGRSYLGLVMIAEISRYICKVNKRSQQRISMVYKIIEIDIDNMLCNLSAYNI